MLFQPTFQYQLLNVPCWTFTVSIEVPGVTCHLFCPAVWKHPPPDEKKRGKKNCYCRLSTEAYWSTSYLKQHPKHSNIQKAILNKSKQKVNKKKQPEKHPMSWENPWQTSKLTTAMSCGEVTLSVGADPGAWQLQTYGLTLSKHC